MYKILWAICIVLYSQTALTQASEIQENNINNPFDYYPFILPKAYQQQLNNYRENWRRLTGFDYSGLHWNQFVVIYTNIGHKVYKHNYLQFIDAISDDEDEEEGEDDIKYLKYPVGTIFIKENFSVSNGQPGNPLNLTIMIKKNKGFEKNSGNWQFLQSDVEGNIMMSGSSKDRKINITCYGCHKNIRERDFVFSTFYNANTQ